MRYKVIQALPDANVGDIYVISNSLTNIEGTIYQNLNNTKSRYDKNYIENSPKWFEKDDFKIGDIVVDKLNGVVKEVTCLDYHSDLFIKTNVDDKFRNASEFDFASLKEIEFFYISKGFIKDTYVEYENGSYSHINYLLFRNGVLHAKLANGNFIKVSSLRLIEELEFPTNGNDSMRIENLKYLKESLKAFEGLSTLYSKLIHMYNSQNNCYYEYDFKNKTTEGYIIECFKDKLTVVKCDRYHSHFVFPTEELAVKSLHFWNHLWKQYYNLK